MGGKSIGKSTISPIHDSLNFSIISSIQLEIKRLREVWIGKDIAARKIEALQELQTRFNQASPTATTQSIIDHWLADSPIIRTPRTGNSNNTHTYQFIVDLVQNHEINPTLVSARQQQILTSIFFIIKNWKNKPHNDLILEINVTLQDFANKHMALEDALKSIQFSCLRNKSNGCYSLFYRRDTMTAFSQILCGLDCNQTTSLLKTHANLEQLKKLFC